MNLQKSDIQVANTNYTLQQNKVVVSEQSLILEIDGQDYELYNVHRSIIRNIAARSFKRSIISSLIGDGAGIFLGVATGGLVQVVQAGISGGLDSKYIKTGCQEVAEYIARMYNLSTKGLEDKINQISESLTEDIGQVEKAMKVNMEKLIKQDTKSVSKSSRKKLFANIVPIAGAFITAYTVRSAVVEFGERIMDQIEDQIENKIRNQELSLNKSMIKKYGNATMGMVAKKHTKGLIKKISN